MNCLRAYRLPIAWMLFAFVLFNGLACSIGHGLMMGMEGGSKPSMLVHPPAAHADAHSAMPMEMPMHSAHSPGEQNQRDTLGAMFGDCSFAGILAMALLCFAALGWLTRLRQPPAARYQRWPGLAFRLFFPALNPRAP